MRSGRSPRNPWLDFPLSAIRRARGCTADGRPWRQAAGTHALRLGLRPQPWTGSPKTAKVFVLTLNPGFNVADYEELRDPDYAEQRRLALSF